MEKNKKSFKELWENKQTHALIVFGLWIAFFVITFATLNIISFFSGDTDTPKIEESITKKTVAELLNDLNTSNYEFEITVTNSLGKYMYTGNQKDNKIIGFLEKENEITKYSIMDEKIYKVEVDNYIVDETLINEIDQNYIILNNLIELVNSKDNDYIKDANSYIYNYSIDDTTEEIRIETFEEIIKSITVNYNENSYVMNFTLN